FNSNAQHLTPNVQFRFVEHRTLDVRRWAFSSGARVAGPRIQWIEQRVSLPLSETNRPTKRHFRRAPRVACASFALYAPPRPSEMLSKACRPVARRRTGSRATHQA